MRDWLGFKCFICCKQVEGTEKLSFWDSWGACLPSTTTLGPEKRVHQGAWRMNGPVQQRVKLNGYNSSMITNYVVPAQAPHMCINTSTHLRVDTHRNTHAAFTLPPLPPIELSLLKLCLP